MVARTGSKTQVSYGEELNELIDLDVDYGGGAVIANYTITTFVALTANKYNGQICFVQYRGGAVDGKMYHIKSNTTTVITFEEDVGTLGLADTDELSITTYGQLPAVTTEYFGHVSETDLPDPKTTPKDHHSHGGANQPERNSASMTKMEFKTTIPIRLVNGKLALYALGYVSDTASNFGALATTTTRAAMIGETKITEAIATPSGFLATDWVQIGDAAEGPEIRQVSSVTANVPVGFDTLVLNQPLRRYHASGVAVKECDITTAKPVTHKVMPSGDKPRFTLEAVWKGADPNHTGNDIVAHYTGIVGNDFDFKSTDEDLECNLGITGLDMLTDQRARATVVNTDWLAREFLYSDSVVTINAVVYARIMAVDFGTTSNTLEMRYHTDEVGIKPYEHVMEGFDHKCNMEIVMTDLTFRNLVYNKTKFDSSIKYTRDSTDDYFTAFFKNSYMPTCPLALPDRTAVIQKTETSVGQFYLEFVDTIEYY